MKMNWWNRLADRMKALEMSPKQLADAAAVEYTSVPKYLRGEIKNPRGDVLARISAAVECEESWLRTGVGPSPSGPRDEERDMVAIPEYNVRFAAGGGQWAEDEHIRDMWVVSAAYAREVRLDRANMAIAEIVGDSMEPLLSAGDRVGLDQNDVNPANPGVFALWDSNALVVKRVERIPGTDPVLFKLISENSQHTTYEVPAEEVNIIGRVVWAAKRIG